MRDQTTDSSYPRQLTTDPIGRVFIADIGNNRICIHDPDLNHLRNITHESMSQPLDVKVSRNCLYVGPCRVVDLGLGQLVDHLLWQSIGGSLVTD